MGGESTHQSFPASTTNIAMDDAMSSLQAPISEEKLRKLLTAHIDEIKAALRVELNSPLPASAVHPTEHNTFANVLKGFIGCPQIPPGVQQTLNLLGLENADLKQEVNSISRENTQLKRSVESSQKKNAELGEEIERLRFEINQAAHDNNRKLCEERVRSQEQAQNMARLRKMLVPPSEDQIDDSQIIAKFTALRALVLRLVRMTWAPAFKDGVSEGSLSDFQLNMLQHFARGDLEWSFLCSRLRFVVFTFLNTKILSRSHYGLGGATKTLDSKLEQIESYVKSHLPSERNGVASDWRLATMKLTENFRDNENILSHEVGEQIWTFMDVLKTNSPEAEEKGKKLLKQVCDQAFDLSLLMRKARDTFSVEQQGADEKLTEYEALAEEETTEPSVGDYQPGLIVFYLFGALVKYTREDPGKPIVLEKGQVVVSTERYSEIS